MTGAAEYAALTDYDSEILIIGAIFRDNQLALELDLQESDFTETWRQRLWMLARDLVSKGSVFAVGPIAAEIPALATYLRSMVDYANPKLYDVKSAAVTVAELGARRRLLAATDEFQSDLRNVELLPEESLAAFQTKAERELKRKNALDKQRVATIVYEGLRNPLPCYATGIGELDHVLSGGFFAGKCYAVAARKKAGKTALAGTISHNLNRQGTKHLFVAGEMSPPEIEQRNMAREFGVNSVQFLTPQRESLIGRAGDYAATIPNSMIYEHAPGLSFDTLRRMVASAKSQHGASGVILDYWQVVTGKQRSETEEYHLRAVAQWLADECRRQNLWCLVFAQVNQDGNTRGGEGLKLACDIYFTLHREKDQPGAWLEMEESRYVLYANVGSETVPGLILNKHGPYFHSAAEFAEKETRRWDR